ncbi:MAG: hypothetical protein EG825_05385 [Rhodocyclaceae bacterium]|nr:hypothetical protein [Rhodocyclaceae bacterium]
METLDINFWYGLAAAIPLSVVANLLTTRIQNVLARRDEKKSAKRREELLLQYARVLKLTKSPAELQIHLLHNILVITLVTSFFGVISGLLFALRSFFPNASQFLQLGQVMSIVGGIAVITICMDAIRDTNRVRKFDLYKASVEAETGPIHPGDGRPPEAG